MAVALTLETAGCAAHAIAHHHNVGAHLLEGVGKAEALLVHGLVHDGGTLSLGQRHDERLLPVSHEAGVHVGFKDDGLELCAGGATGGVGEADALVGHLVQAAHLAELVQERGHVLLSRAAHEDVAAGGQGRGGPGSGLVAVGQGGVVVAGQLVHALDDDGAVLVDEDDGAHLLQHGDEVNNLGLNRGVAQNGLALGAHAGEQNLLGSAYGGVVQHDLGALQTLFGHDQGGAGLVVLLDDGAELTQRGHVVVDGAVTDLAAAQVGDARGAQGMQQRAHHQNRNTRVTAEELNLLRVLGRGGRVLGGVEGENTGLGIIVNLRTVQFDQGGNDLHVAQVGDVAQGRGGRTV